MCVARCANKNKNAKCSLLLQRHQSVTTFWAGLWARCARRRHGMQAAGRSGAGAGRAAGSQPQ